jgi:Fe-S cluster biogenesis protein NfuA
MVKPSPDTADKIGVLIETLIKPALTPGEGDIVFRGFKDGTVYVEMTGSGSKLLARMDKLLRREFSEVNSVADYAETHPVLGLETEMGKAVQKVIDERVNPGVAAHGGHIALVDVLGDTVYVRMEGGCQGCGMAAATLKQGISKDIQEVVPSIRKVLDVTDHDGGKNPFYSPAPAKKRFNLEHLSRALGLKRR